MSNYFGQKGQRVELALTVDKAASFSTMYGDNTVYTFSDTEGNVFVWKTTSLLGIDREIQRPGCDWKDWAFEGAHPRDRVTVKATIKDHSEYRGVKQTVLTRCKVLTITHAPTKEEIDAAHKVAQLATLTAGDFIWEMPYRQYKEHYADCETIAGSLTATSMPTASRSRRRQSKLSSGKAASFLPASAASTSRPTTSLWRARALRHTRQFPERTQRTGCTRIFPARPTS